ncbi:hypothetical protein MMYC01_200951 [Madurella mycetomatis]|uniref:Uncharacterized protein n=1 Tax=Madurella mycetomatis TaxID=100816 RepID=A0A175WEG6_9PEZI|nr:hypothetical protein MMYC01_205659 [Madurella mycetomatis]KXX82157.1 hypothetical protein MMYC01_200951 [Madurella mycetomatis]
MDPDLKAGVNAHVSPCELVPPCRQGGHRTCISEGRQHAAKPIGKYYFTEDALKHDLAALKRGAVYQKTNFTNEQKPGYLGIIYPCEPSPGTPSPKAPTRIQPPRAAKRKAPEPTLQPPPPRRARQQQTAKQKKTVTTVPARPFRETKGDYTLAPYDWAQFCNHNQGEHRPSPWSYVQLQGLDVAYFVMRLERAVREKIRDLVTAPSIATTNGAGEKQDHEETTGATTGAGADQRKRFCCALASLGARGCSNSLLPSSPPFKPAAALAPGEDWRPPAGGGEDGGHGGLTDAADGIGRGGTRGCSSWAADEVGRREERDRQHTPAPDAEMEISPTLGRWPASERIVATEGLEGHVVEVSGLRCAMDLCACPITSSEVEADERLRFLML